MSLGLAAGACTDRGNTPSARTPQRPNILIVLTDDQRASTISFMPRTIQHLKDGGTSFTQAVATTPLCCPSRASIFTGQYVHNHGLKTNIENDMDEQSTMQRHLSSAGYRTAIFGKYLNAWDLAESPAHFDRWAIFSKARYSFTDGEWNVDGSRKIIPDYATDYVAERAVEFLRETEAEDGRPWFLFLAPPAPHEPYTPAERHRAVRVPPWKKSPSVGERNRSDKHPYVRAKVGDIEDAARIRRRQLRTLKSVHEMIHRLMRLQENLGETSNTLTFFLSDNGFLWNEHGLFGSIRSKGNPYIESVRIPLLLHWPGRVVAGIEDGRLAANIDIAPTVLDAAGLRSATSKMDGKSLLQKWDRRFHFLEYWHRSEIPRWMSLMTRGFQYTEYYEGGEISFREYYRLKSDPWQLKSALGDRDPTNDPPPARIRNLHRTITRLSRCSGASCS